MTVQWYRVKRTYQKPQGGFLAIGLGRVTAVGRRSL
jgi:hypothetical protein